MNFKKICFFLIITSNFLLLSGCETKKQQLEKNAIKQLTSNIQLNDENVKVLDIHYIKNNYNKDYDTKRVKIKNISDLNISNIIIKYNELDSSSNIVSKSKNVLQASLMPSEVIYVDLSCKNYMNNIEISSYDYDFEDNKISVDIKTGKSTIKKIDNNNFDIKNYDVLTTSKIYKSKDNKEDNVYEIKVKNLSNNDLGNIKIKIAELNDKNECIKVNDVIAYEILKSSEEKKLQIILSKEAKNAEFIGYSYDNITDKSNISIDKKINKVDINKL